VNPALVDSKNNLEHESGEGDRERERAIHLGLTEEIEEEAR